MSLSVSGYGQQHLIYQFLQSRAAQANNDAAAPPKTAPTPAATPVSPASPVERRGFTISDTLASFLVGLVSGGPLPADTAQNPMSPAVADSSSATPAAAPAAPPAAPHPQTQGETDAPAQPQRAAAAEPAAAADPVSTQSNLGVVLAAYVSNMPSHEAEPAQTRGSGPPASPSAPPPTHPGSHAHPRDHAAPPAAAKAA